MFAYMFRRFGVPEYGSDGYKEIAVWYITTPDPHVALCVSPKPSGALHSFGYMLDGVKYDDRRSKAQQAAVSRALRAAASDLLYPVSVRDVCINARGKLRDEEVTDEEVDYFKWAGYGVPHEYFTKTYRKPE